MKRGLDSKREDLVSEEKDRGKSRKKILEREG